jgi:hypothetical protein
MLTFLSSLQKSQPSTGLQTRETYGIPDLKLDIGLIVQRHGLRQECSAWERGQQQRDEEQSRTYRSWIP